MQFDPASSSFSSSCLAPAVPWPAVPLPPWCSPPLAPQVIVVGTKTAVDAARIYLATSVQMVSEYQQESKEAEQMRRELRQMGANANTDFDSFPALGGGGKGGRGGAGGGVAGGTGAWTAGCSTIARACAATGWATGKPC